MFEFLVGDFSIVAGATLALIAFWRLFPFAVNRILQDSPAYRSYLNRGILLTAAAAILWIAAFDNWRQVIGIPTGWIQDDKAQRASDPFYSGNISDPVRAVSWILFFGAVIGGAYLFARFSRGYAEPLILGPLSVISFFILNTIRLRYDVDSVRIAYGAIDSPLDMALTLMWIAVLIISMGLIVSAMYLMTWAPFAFVMSLVYRKLINRQRYEEPPIFRRLRERRMEQSHSSG
ncbi:MAG: hypothetical protein R3A46_04910 [Thermomicrobiales bacterium]